MWFGVLAGIVYYTYADPNVNARIVIVSAFHAACGFAIAGRVYVSRPPERPPYNYLFVAGVSALGAIYAVAPTSQTALLQLGAMQIAFLALGILVLPTLSIGLVMMAHDRLAQRLERLARFDDLTGALSRKALLEAASARLAQAALGIASSSRSSTSVTSSGSTTATAMRRATTCCGTSRASSRRTGATATRSDASAARSSVFCAAHESGEVIALVERLRAAVETTPCAVPGGVLHYTFSAGIAQWDGRETLASLMARVDARLYAAKIAGRNRVMVATRESALA